MPDVFVVDNGSTDGTQAYIQERFPEVLFIQSEKNLGFGKANNIGLQYALDNGYDYVYLLNQDAWIENDTIERLVSLSINNPGYGILSPFQMSNGLKLIDKNFASVVLSSDSCPFFMNELYNHEMRDVYNVKGVMAAHWFMTRNCLLKVGGFSPSFPHYGEDDNYIDRLFFKGLKVGIVPSLRVVHDRELRTDSMEKKIYLLYIKTIRELSNPNERIKRPFVKALSMAVRGLLIFKSLTPFSYFFKIVFSYNRISRNRLISMNQECAFLVNKSL